eukprot:4587175-Prymnesium_polylepis.1
MLTQQRRQVRYLVIGSPVPTVGGAHGDRAEGHFAVHPLVIEKGISEEEGAEDARAQPATVARAARQHGIIESDLIPEGLLIKAARDAHERVDRGGRVAHGEQPVVERLALPPSDDEQILSHYARNVASLFFGHGSCVKDPVVVNTI